MFLGLCIVISFSASQLYAGQTLSLKGTIFEQAGNEYDVDPVLLYSIALVESAVDTPGKAGFVNPFPWTLRTDKPYYGSTREQAEKELLRLLENRKSVDVGLMQVNTKWHGHRVKNPLDLLDPLTNVRVAAAILSEQIDKAKDAETAVGRYHSFNPERARWYAQHVLRIYTLIKKRD